MRPDVCPQVAGHDILHRRMTSAANGG